VPRRDDEHRISTGCGDCDPLFKLKTSTVAKTPSLQQASRKLQIGLPGGPAAIHIS